MTPISDMVEEMFAEGIDPLMIVLAVRTLETVTLRERDASRFVTVTKPSPAAARAKRYRENRKQIQHSAKANDVAETGDETAKPERDASRSERDDAPTFLSSLSLNLEGSSEEGRKQKKKEGTEIARARGRRMEPDAILTDEFLQAAVKLGAEPSRVPGMWAEHVDYWIGVPGQRGVKTEPNGWLATWRNDVRRKLERGLGNGSGRTKPQTDKSVVAAADRILEKLHALNEPLSQN